MVEKEANNDMIYFWLLKMQDTIKLTVQIISLYTPYTADRKPAGSHEHELRLTALVRGLCVIALS